MERRRRRVGRAFPLAILAILAVVAIAACSLLSTGVEEMSPATPPALGEPPRPSPVRPIPGEAAGETRLWQAVAISADGNVAAYQDSVYVKSGDMDGPLYVWDRGSGQVTFVSDNVEPRTAPALSGDGRVVVFAEERDSTTTRDGVNPDPDVHRIVRWSATTGLSPLTGFDYEQVPDLATSADGRVVAFVAFAKHALTGYDAYVVDGDRPAVRVSPAATTEDGGGGWSGGDQIVAVSGDGRRVAYMHWQNHRSMVFVGDVQSGAQRAVRDIVPGVTAAEEASLSGDGRRLAVRLEGATWGHDGSVAVLDVDRGAVLARSRPALHPGADTLFGRNPHLSEAGDLVAYEAPGKSEGQSLDAGELFKPDVVIVMQVGSQRAKYLKPSGYSFDLLGDGRLVNGGRLYAF